MKIAAIEEWKRMLEEDKEDEFWVSIGVSALIAALILQQIIKIGAR